MEFVGTVMHGTKVQSVTESTDGVRSMWLLNEGSVLSAARWSPVD